MARKLAVVGAPVFRSRIVAVDTTHKPVIYLSFSVSRHIDTRIPRA
jgi:hypothetical protein